MCKIVFYQQCLTERGAPPPQQTYAISILICPGLKTNKQEKCVDTDTIQFQPKPAASVWNAYRWRSRFHSGVDLYCAPLPLQCAVAATTACCVHQHRGKYINPFTGSEESGAFDTHTHTHAHTQGQTNRTLQYRTFSSIVLRTVTAVLFEN